LEIIQNAPELRRFLPEWSEFTRRHLDVSPFQMPEWLTTWWSHFGSGELRTIVFRDYGKVIGVLPCFKHEWNGRHQLTLVGSGITDYLDPIAEPSLTAEMIDALWAQLKRWNDWDVCDWQDLSRDTPLQVLGDVAPETPGTAIAIEHPFHEYLASRPKNLRRNLRRYREKAEAIAPVSFHVTDTADPDLLNSLVHLHRVRWQKEGEAGMIAANRSEAFLREVAGLLASSGLLRIFTVRFGERIAAILLALRNQTTIYSYLSAFDPEWESFGFGRELLAQALRHTHENGYRRWDFLRGEEPYKFSWGAELVPKCRVMIRP
jgi:CelD/BcsL family acetyltransferase involved in cellulose biosynthesis